MVTQASRPITRLTYQESTSSMNDMPHVAAPLVSAKGMSHAADQGLATRNVNVYYGDKQALFDVSVDIAEKAVTAFIGPSGCGKSTFLRCINRMNDTIPIARVTARSRSTARTSIDRDARLVELRARVGMVFQKPNPFPKSIYENVAYGPRIHGLARSKADSTSSSRKRCKAPGCGTRSRIGCTSRAPACPAASSSACASPGRSPSTPK